MEEGSKPIVQEPEVEEDKGSNNGGGSTTSYNSEEYVKVNQDDSIDDAAGDVPAEPVEDVGSIQAPKLTETGIGEILMSKIDPRGLEQGPVGNCEDSDPVIDLIYWRDVKKTAVVFSSILLILFPLICYSVLTVLAYAALSVLVVTVGIRLYRLVLQTLNGTQQPHPFQEYLDVDLSLSPENAQKYANVISVNVNRYVGNARDLLMVKNTLSSLKFGVFLWLLTYVGALFNGLTFLIIDVIILFTVPPVYEKYQAQIDGYCGLAKDKVNAVVSGIKEKIPGKKEKTQ